MILTSLSPCRPSRYSCPQPSRCRQATASTVHHIESGPGGRPFAHFTLLGNEKRGFEKQSNGEHGWQIPSWMVGQQEVGAQVHPAAFIAALPPQLTVCSLFNRVMQRHVDGFTLGTITDFEAEPSHFGDAFVVAPDGGRGGLIWEVRRNGTSSRCARQ